MAGDWQLYLTAACAPRARIGFEAGILNIHRRHDESVTHRLDAAAHVAEIARCQAMAAKRLKLPADILRRQGKYRDEVAAQLTPRRKPRPAARFNGKMPRRGAAPREAVL